MPTKLFGGVLIECVAFRNVKFGSLEKIGWGLNIKNDFFFSGKVVENAKQLY